MTVILTRIVKEEGKNVDHCDASLGTYQYQNYSYCIPIPKSNDCDYIPTYIYIKMADSIRIPMSK